MAGRAWLLPLVVLFAVARFATADVTVPDSGQFVNDTAGALSPEQQKQLEFWLRELEEKTGAQVKVLTVKSTQPEDFFTFVQRHAELWKLGQKGKDNGVLVAMAVDDHEFRVHVGRGFEGLLPDSWCGTLFRQVARPAFQQGNFGQGLFEATITVVNRIADDAGVKLTGIPQRRLQPQPDDDPYVALLMLAIIAAFLVYGFYQQRRGGRPGMWSSYGGPFVGGFGGGSFGGGSFGGSSFGGSSGGSSFGGSFGGGGSFSGAGGGGKW